MIFIPMQKAKKDDFFPCTFSPIIQSLADQDFYKITMGQVFFFNNSNTITRFEFTDRNPNNRYTPEMVKEITNQIRKYCELRFTKEEIDYHKKIS